LAALPRRVLVVGLDCAEPTLVLERYRGELPTFARLIREGAYGWLASTTPPITVPAWTTMTTGWSPGRLGIYGFRNRRSHGYGDLRIATNADVEAPRIWEVLARAGLSSVVLGVPQTYPPRPFSGWLISSFLAPAFEPRCAHPPGLVAELQREVGEYMLDVIPFRTEEKSWLLEQIRRMTRLRFRALRYLLRTRDWRFAMVVEMGVDRLHHGFWRFCDPGHPRYEPGNPFESAMLDYYKLLDGELAELLDLCGPETAVLVVSDHGAKPLRGGVCINEWLIREGYLALREPPAGPTRLTPELIDWSRTLAWGEGGYYGRVFLNVRGREPQGTIPPGEAPRVRDELARRMREMPGPDGRPLGNVVLLPEEVYPVVRGIPPDLMVYFGDLDWRSVGSVGMGDVFTEANDTGPDDANHAQEGLFIARGFPGQPTGRLEGLRIADITPTILAAFRLVAPRPQDGAAIFGPVAGSSRAR
jgi:predicted AlkP superfamily phosphohydrolase/phosphomutase